MSIDIRNLSRKYGHQIAVDNISFQLQSGEIAGFLGPNGAGKSTTMKIISAYIPQTLGTVEVCGFDVNKFPLEVKQNIGYLPEHNPLYLDMYVTEFLDFAGRASGIKKPKKRVEEVIEITGLNPERKKLIAQLSKGYRQRVGLAQALLHEPKVLILDEPTSGLDPNQVQEIRKLILQLGRDRTVLLSTHIMQEVEAVCSRVIIINKGKIAADDLTENITRKVKQTNTVMVRFKKEINVKKLEKQQGIGLVEHLEDTLYRISADRQTDLPELLFNFALEEQTIILEQQQDKANLESVFQQLTKNA